MSSKRTTGREPSRRGVVWVDDGPEMTAPEIENETFTIGQLAADFGVSPRTLRFYESKGLLSPRHEGSARLYSARDRERLALILQGKRLAFTLAEIRDMVAAQEDQRESQALDVSRERCLEQINLLERQKRAIDAALAELRRIYSSFYVPRPDSDRTGG